MTIGIKLGRARRSARAVRTRAKNRRARSDAPLPSRNICQLPSTNRITFGMFIAFPEPVKAPLLLPGICREPVVDEIYVGAKRIKLIRERRGHFHAVDSRFDGVKAHEQFF